MAYKENTKGSVEVIKEFSGGQKPEKLLKRIIEMSSDEGDIVLDFHLGTGTTAATAMKMRRQFIGCEQMEGQVNIELNRLSTVIGKIDKSAAFEQYKDYDKSGISKAVNWQGGGEFVYVELKKLNEKFVDAIEKAQSEEDIPKIWEEMKMKAFFDFNIDMKNIEAHMEEFKGLELEEQKKVLMELLDKNQMYVNRSSLGDAETGCTDDEKKWTRDFYGKEE